LDSYAVMSQRSGAPIAPAASESATAQSRSVRAGRED
jgi:hypothetical protein